MIVTVTLPNAEVSFRYSGSREGSGAVYSMLEDIPAISESTDAESGSTSIVLTLSAYEILGFPLGRGLKVLRESELLFEGVITDITVSTSLILQVEA